VGGGAGGQAGHHDFCLGHPWLLQVRLAQHAADDLAPRDAVHCNLMSTPWPAVSQ
jgi:hypothetical protein